MRKQSKELKKGDKLNVFGKEGLVEEIEFSDIGKHGKRKARIVVRTGDGQRVVMIRPEDYPFETHD